MVVEVYGGGGVWGDANMAAHPQLSPADATEIVKYILSLGTVSKSLPTKGTYTATIPKGASDQGVLILRASYTDKGANGMAAATSEKLMVLRSPNVAAGKADLWDGIMKYSIPQPPMDIMIGLSNNAYISHKKIDLTGIEQIVFAALAPTAYGNPAGGIIEVHIDSPTGEKIGESDKIVATKGKSQTPEIIIKPVKLKPTQGKHDLYFVYRNNEAAPGSMLFILVNATFVYNDKTPVALSLK
jgi:cytochrome c